MSRAHAKPPSGSSTCTSTGTSKGRKRGDSSSRPRLPVDPFAGRDNYPPIDEAFLDADQSQSFCSHVSSLNLSIGARAALDEHLRHVARFGLDESHCVDEENSKNGIPQPPQTLPRDPYDEQWDRLVGSNSSNAPGTPNSSFFLRNTFGYQNYPPDDAASSRLDESGEIAEVLTDLSSDFFNSSRVNLLRTPEKNLSRQGEVTTRDDNVAFINESINESFVSEPEQFPGHHHHHDALQDHLRADTSFSALSAVDASRISALDVSHISADVSDGGILLLPPRPSPDTSLLVRDHRSNMDADNDLMMRLLLHSTATTLPNSSGPPRAMRSEWPTTTSLRASPQSKNVHHGKRGSGGVDGTTKTSLNKENLADDDLNIDTLGLSPISNRTGTLSRRTFTTSSPGLLLAATTDSTTNTGLPSVPLFALLESSPSADVPWEEEDRVEVLTNNNDVLQESQISEVVYERTHDSDISTLQNQSSSAKNSSLSSKSRSASSAALLFSNNSNNNNSKNTSNSLPSQGGVGSSDGNDDRRRYRTVVPSRVFLQDPNEFPEQYDSFSCPLSFPAREPLQQSAAVSRSWQSAPT